MRTWLLAVMALTLVGCAAQPPATINQAPETTAKPAAMALGGDDTGVAWLKASADQKLTFCKASMTSYKSSGAASFSVSASVNELTPEKLCKEMDSYFSGKGTGLISDRLGHAAGMAVIFAGKPYRPS